MTKTTKTLALASTLLLAAQGSSVQAEDLTQPTVSISTENQAETSTDLATVEKLVKETDQAKARQEEQVKQATQMTQEATDQLLKQEEVVKQVTELVKQASPENKASLETEIKATQAQLAHQEQVISQVEREKTQVEKNKLAREAVILHQEQVLTQTQEVLTQKEEAYHLAQVVLDGTGATAVLAERSSAQEAYEQATAHLTASEATLAQALLSDQTHQETIKDKATELATLSQELEQENIRQAQARQKKELDQWRLNQATADLTKTRQAYESLTTITLTPEYVTQLKAFAAGGFVSEESTLAEKELMAMNSQLLSLNAFTPNPSEATTKLDPSNLDDAIRQELTLYAVDLVNQIRRQMGTTEAVAHRQVIELAERIADQYEADNWDWNKSITVSPHHVAAIKSEAQAIGLRPSAHYENIHTIGTMYAPISTLTLAELKEKVHQAVIKFMFNGQEYFHAMSVSATPGYGNPLRYLGLAFSNRSDAFSIHLIGIDESSIEDKTRFDASDTLTPIDHRTAVTRAYQLAQTAHRDAETTYQEARASQELADLRVKDKRRKVNQTQHDLTTLSARPLQAPTAQVQRDQAEQALRQAEQRLELAKAAEKQLTADIATKKEAVVEAGQALAQARAILRVHQEALMVEQIKFQTYRTNLDDKANLLNQEFVRKANLEQKLAQQRNQLSLWEQAPDQLKQAKELEISLKELVNKRQRHLQKALDDLERLKAKSEQFNAQLKMLLAADELEKVVNTTLPPKASSSSSNHSVIDSNLASIYHQVTPSRQSSYGKQTNPQKVLPKTGTSSSWSLVVSGLMSLLTAFGLRKKRRY